MVERNNRLNKPISDDTLYAAGMPRDIPEKEPVPAPPAVQPVDFDPGLPGIEYRAMADTGTQAPNQRPSVPSQGASTEEDASPFAWLSQRRARRS